ncbi:MAG: hypothetical protein N2652_01960 [Kiritimatiellae bacterium]|nr:hypothetical protein [Kiritimatiellia bacterium]
MPFSADEAIPGWTALCAAARAGKLAHAYLIVGAPRREGLRAAVRMLQLVFCGEAGAACGQCRGCRRVERRMHPDVHWLEPESRSRRITIGDPMSRESDPGVRYGLIEPLWRSPVEGGWKAGVVLAADRLTLPAANALLKTLEEPPPETLLLLVSEAPHQIPATVLSRCQRIALAVEAAPPEPWRTRFLDLLAATAADDSLARRLATAAAMVALWAEAGAQAEADAREEKEGETPEAAVAEARGRAAWIELRALFLAEWQRWERDALALAMGAAAGSGRPAAHAAALAEEARRAGVQGIRERLRQLDTLERRLNLNLSEPAALCAFFRDAWPAH